MGCPSKMTIVMKIMKKMVRNTAKIFKHYDDDDDDA